ncbi:MULTISPECIES: hypothetical protein [Deefgea]|uniref:Uncharacterized protein n=1 Tax=Deefgea chitinilytica TaxID=570276 RepID=A0ABS2CDH1_9NEIS|nr:MULTISPECIES: hypothetical protein [Deefgea]MBM5572165.1 hypothetical protein [Deefgea chitinilytica]MBM9889400.1 hypothetical protein [Deefgea sp. CFH1-16]
MEVLKIELPEHLTDHQAMAAWVREHIDAFYPAFDLDVTDYDAHAMLEKVHIKDVDVAMAHIAIAYEYDYAIVNGCRDLNFSGTSKPNRICGNLHGRILTFPIHQSLPQRSTCDEL